MSSVVVRIQYVDGRVEDRTLEAGAHDIGRDVGRIALGDANVSGLHARIEVLPGRVVITDLNSSNGTYDAAGNRLTAPHVLQPNVPVRLGGSSLTLLPPARPLAGGTALIPQYVPPPAQPPHQAVPAVSAQLPHSAPPPHAAPPPHGAPPHAPYSPHAAHAGYGGPAPQPAAASGGLGFQLPYAPPPPGPGAPVLDYAQWPNRIVGYLIDSFFVVVVMGLLYLVVGGAMTGLAAVAGDNQAAQGALSGTCCLVIAIFPMATLLVGVFNRIYLVSKRGYSIGQGVMKLRVVDGNGNLLSMGAAALRLLAMIFLAMLPFGQLLDLLWPLFDAQRQTLHDKAVNSFVINAGSRA